ncbi:sulfotransferase domain-containing protein [Rubrivivax albus]|uniref:Uncharacterized protein n=1 Tax=Rubrivivax albus TaxID=2499835 RepID=A0A3S2U6V4_9BURK|nr:sulfotransferase domain-containing protein [Rubrivivax albus]RVT49478.1 hypothetical protein ENE75_20630 [Rubrivivax albus]
MLVLSAGMPRSGSTWLYNALRLMLARRFPGPGELACGWVGDIGRLPATAACRLVKIHEWDDALVTQAEFVTWSYRDLRDAMASQHRKFGGALSLQFADYLVRQDARWMTRADHVMRYEAMLADPRRELVRLANALKLPDIDPAAVQRELEGLSFESEGPRNEAYHELTLLHRGHVTDGRAGSWRNGMPEDLARQIVSAHAGWFSARGYDTGNLDDA